MLVVWSFFAGAAVCEKAPAEPDLNIKVRAHRSTASATAPTQAISRPKTLGKHESRPEISLRPGFVNCGHSDS